MTYKLTSSDSVILVEDGRCFPAVDGNPDYDAYVLWLADGGVPLPADELPPMPQTCTPLEFIERFTDAEQLAVATATATSPALRLWFDKLMAAQEIVFTDPRLGAGLDAFVAAGTISPSRKTQILS